MEIVFQCEEEQLDSKQIEEIRKVLNDGGMCILPSDSTFILTGYLQHKGMTDDLDKVLERNGLQISMAFASLGQVCKKMKLTDMGRKFVKRLSPDGLTFVASPSYHYSTFSKTQLHADGTVGMMISRSKVERELAKVNPIPTTPIRDEANEEVFNTGEAIQIIEERMKKYQVVRPIAVVDGVVPHPGRLSTVVKEERHNGLWRIVVLRENSISFDAIDRVAKQCGYTGTVRREWRAK